MQIPSGLFGSNREVGTFCRKIASRMKKGASWDEAFGETEMVDTSERGGLILLSGPGPISASEPHFQPYLPLIEIEKLFLAQSLLQEQSQSIFDSVRQSAWGTLGLISRDNLMWVYDHKRYRYLLKSAIQFWDVFDAEGARYSTGSTQSLTLWQMPNNVKYVLANSGVSSDTLNAPLPEGGIATLTKLVENKVIEK